MAAPTGRYLSLSPARRLIADLMAVSRRVPTVAMEP